MKKLIATLMITAFTAIGLHAQTTTEAKTTDSKLSVQNVKRSEMKAKLMNSDRTTAEKKKEIRAKAAAKPGGKKIAVHKLQRKRAASNKANSHSGNVRVVDGKKAAVKKDAMNIE